MILSSRPVARHAEDGTARLRVSVPIGIGVTVLGIIWALAEGPSGASVLPSAEPVPPHPAVAQRLPAVEVSSAPIADHCAAPSVQQALGSGDDNAVVAAFGGGEAFRNAVSAGNASCIDLRDPAHLWLVVNKARPLVPEQYAPAALASPALLVDDSAGPLRADVASALDGMSAAAQDAGVGALGLGSGYRSYGTQVSTYSGQVEIYGPQDADSLSARPGFSEHQTGLAADVEQCFDGDCSGITAFGSTSAGAWVAEHCWEHGFVVRYVDGVTGTTGYSPEPWHLRYVGTELASAYHAGGHTSLERFFGLPDAPDYGS